MSKGLFQLRTKLTNPLIEAWIINGLNKAMDQLDFAAKEIFTLSHPKKVQVKVHAPASYFQPHPPSQQQTGPTISLKI